MTVKAARKSVINESHLELDHGNHPSLIDHMVLRYDLFVQTRVYEGYQQSVT
jgi:hypothetical protein